MLTSDLQVLRCPQTIIDNTQVYMYVRFYQPWVKKVCVLNIVMSWEVGSFSLGALEVCVNIKHNYILFSPLYTSVFIFSAPSPQQWAHRVQLGWLPCWLMGFVVFYGMHDGFVVIVTSTGRECIFPVWHYLSWFYWMEDSNTTSRHTNSCLSMTSEDITWTYIHFL